MCIASVGLVQGVGCYFPHSFTHVNQQSDMASVLTGSKRPISEVIDLDAPSPCRRRVQAVVDLSDQPSTPFLPIESAMRSRASAPVSPKEASSVEEAPKKRNVAYLVTLAKAWSPGKDISGWYMSEKLDGMRAIWVGGALYSRAGNRVHAPAWFLEQLPTGIVLDGELFMGRGRFQEVMSVCRSFKEKKEWADVKYVVFDAPEAGGPISERLKTARDAVEVGGGSAGSVYVLKHSICTGEEHALEELKNVEEQGGEGIMIRNPSQQYRYGRVSDLLKLKSFKDDEAIITGHERGGGKHNGRLGALQCQSRSGKAFKVGTGFKDHEREDPPAVGQIITFKYFELTKAGVPRFPVFYRVRPDVSASCFGRFGR